MNSNQTPVQPLSDTPEPLVPQPPTEVLAAVSPMAQPSTAPMSPPAPGVAPTTEPVEDPGRTLGIVGFVLSMLGFGAISLVISIIAKIKSKKAGRSNGFALAGIIISAAQTITLVSFIFFGLNYSQQCTSSGHSLQWVENGDDTTTLVCDESAETPPQSSEASDTEVIRSTE